MPQTHTPSKATQLLEQLKRIDIVGRSPKKKKDSSEQELGVLYGELQRIWALRDAYSDKLQEFLDKILDLSKCVTADYEQFGGNLPEETSRQYSEKLAAIRAEIEEPAVMFQILNSTFNGLLMLEPFKTPDDMPIIGIREGFTVVCRKDDVRGDKKSPLDALRKLLRKEETTHIMVMEIVLPNDEKKEPLPGADQPK